MRLQELLETEREAIQQIAAHHGVRNLRLFGSVARGEAGPESDIDLLVTLDDGRSLLDLIAAKQDLEDLLGRSVDVVTEAAISPYIRDRVIRDAVSL